MSPTIDKKEEVSPIRCVNCSKLLARNFLREYFEIKCLRCGTLNVIFDQIKDQVIITDSKGEILHINEAAEKHTGYSNKDALGKKPGDLWGNQMPKEFYKEMWRVIKEERKAFETTLINKNKDGKLYEIKLVISPILNADGEILFYVGSEIIINNENKSDKK